MSNRSNTDGKEDCTSSDYSQHAQEDVLPSQTKLPQPQFQLITRQATNISSNTSNGHQHSTCSNDHLEVHADTSVGPSLAKKRCRQSPSIYDTAISDRSTVSAIVGMNNTMKDKPVDHVDVNIAKENDPHLDATGNTSNILRSTKPCDIRHTVSSSDTINIDKHAPSTTKPTHDILDLGLVPNASPDLDLDPEKLLLSHGIDIFNNDNHRQDLINFCERMLTECYQSQDQYSGLFQNNNNNVGLSPPPFFNGPDNVMYRTCNGPLGQQQHTTKQQKAITAQFFNGHQFVPVQVYVEES